MATSVNSQRLQPTRWVCQLY